MDLFGLLPAFGGFAATLLAFVAALSIIVFVHEYGHYIVGRWCGIGADVFSIGFGPVLIARVDRRGTRWQIAALPFGGYVRFKGDSNAASAKDGETVSRLSEAERRATMHGAPLWARSATVAAGPVANFLMSIVVFAAILMIGGLTTDKVVVGELRALPSDYATELRPGDEIRAIEAVPIPDYEAFYEYAREAGAEPRKPYLVFRDGTETTVPGPFPLLPLVASVVPRSAAQAAGIRPDDVILAVDGKRIWAFHQLQDAVKAAEPGAGLALEVWRGGARTALTLVPRTVDVPGEEGGWEQRQLIGITGDTFFAPETYTPGPVEALGLGVERTWSVVTASLSGLWHMITGAISSCNLSGPVGIAQASGAMASQGIESFIWFVAVLSTAVGLLNLFPIPVLDGGHLVFFGYEAVAGRPPPDRALQVMMAIGLAAILSLMAFGLANDLLCP